MNIFVYNSRDPQVVGQRVAEIVSKELNLSAPAFEIEMPDIPVEADAKTVIGDIARTLFGGKANNLFTIIFKPQKPRPFEIRANVIKSGPGCAVCYLLYSASLSKNIDTETSLGEPKVIGAAKFSGNEAAQKLNANAEFLKRANKLARSVSTYGPLKLSVQRVFTVFPSENESATMVVGTLARPTAMGLNISMDLMEFADLANMIEKIL